MPRLFCQSLSRHPFRRTVARGYLGAAFAVLVLLGMASPSAMEYLFTVISKGGTGVNKSEYMPAFEGPIAKDDIENVIAFIRTLV